MILISAGHYPARPGACFGDFCEHGEAVKWRDLIVHKLGVMGIQAATVPPGSLRKKVDYINKKGATCAVEIHFNAATKKEKGKVVNVGKGCETLYAPGSTKGIAFAEYVHGELANLFSPDRGIKEGWYRMDPAQGVDFFLAKTNCPALILEPDFIHRKDIITVKRVEACVILA